MNIEEGNKFIAEFMGGELVEFIDLSNSNCTAFKMNNSIYPFYSLAYHSSWDWQVPVWNKMYELCTASLNVTEYYEQEKGLHSAIRLNQPEISIPYLIHLIEWYNTNKK
jgi:hypothetical protein